MAGCNGVEEASLPPVVDGDIGDDDVTAPELDGDEVLGIDDFAVSQFTFEVPGTLEDLVAGSNSCEAVYRTAGSFENPATVSRGVYGKEGELSTLPELPQASLRSYGHGIQLSDGSKCYPYQSTSGFSGQQGDQHGLVITNASGEVIVDHDLDALGFTRPSAVLEYEGTLLVLVTNGSTDGLQIRYERPAVLLAINDYLDGDSLIDQLSLPDDYTNPSSMALVEDEEGNQRLTLAAADAVLGEPTGRAVIFHVDPDSLTLLDEEYPSSQGIGLNGKASVNEKGNVLFAGQDPEGGSLIELSTEGIQELTPPQEGYEYVTSAHYVSDKVFLINGQDEFGQTGIGLMSSDGDYEELDSFPQLEAFPVLIDKGAQFFCTGVANTYRDDGGQWSSTLTLYEIVSE